MKHIALAKGIDIPIDVATQKLAFIGRSSSGKTYAATKLAEELLLENIQSIILDPVGVWHGLRSSSDGKGKGFSIPVFGGEWGDIPLLPSSGELIAKVIIEKGISAVLDVSYMRKNERKDFVTSFAETFFFLKKKNRSPVHMIVEEAQVFIPQRTMHGEERMLGAMEDICKLGRNYGIGISLISQRPQSIHKDCLNQTEALFAFQINGAHERKAIEDWIVDKGLSKSTVGEDLSGLPVGSCFLWSPQWLRILQKVKILPKTTFDASSTPKVGDTAAKSRKLASIDLERIKADMESVINTKKENDPVELKKKIKELEKELKKGEGPAKVVDNSQINDLKKIIYGAEKKIKEYESWSREVIAVIKRFNINFTDNIEKVSAKAPAALPGPLCGRKIKEVIGMFPERERISASISTPLTGRASSKSGVANGVGSLHHAQIGSLSSNNGSIPKGELAVLTACAQFPNGLLRTQLTILTGYKRSSRDAYIQRLKEKKYVSSNGEKIGITEYGIQALGPDFKPLPVGQELRQHWLDNLPHGERLIFDLICESYPHPITREELSAKTEYQRSSRDAYIQRMLAKEIIEIPSKGEVIAAESLFE